MALEQIIENGLEGLDTAVSILIKEAMRIKRSQVLEAEPWQRTWNRCHVHLQRNATAYVPKVAMLSAAARDIANILSAPNRDEAKRLLDLAVEKYRSNAPRLSAWMEENIPEAFTVFMLPYAMRRRLRQNQ